MLESELRQFHPTLFHLAEPDSWASIQRHGLMSTLAILDKFEVTGLARDRLLQHRRAQKTVLTHPLHGSATLRDNKPLTETKLAASLTDGSTVSQYLRAVNSRTFMWPTRERLDLLFKARAYRASPQLVIEVGTVDLLRRHRSQISLSPINSGATEPFATSRSLATFARVQDFDFAYWSQRRGSRRKAVVEVCVDYSIPDLADFVQDVYVRHPDGTRSEA